MNTEKDNSGKVTEPEKPRGFLGRMLSRMDQRLKAKARDKSTGCCSSGGSTEKGGDNGKCC